MTPSRHVEIPGLPSPDGLDTAIIGRVCAGIDTLRHAKGYGAGASFGLRQWQKQILGEIFGRVDGDGYRQYRTVYIEFPRKNGKTELLAAVANYMLSGDVQPDTGLPEQGAEVYCAAAEREQASLVYNAAKYMVETHPFLSKECKIFASTKRITHPPTGSFLKALSSEAYSKHGLNASCVIYDELHAAPNRDLWDVLTTSMGARRQPLVFVITTAGWDRTSICWEQHQYALKVRDGVIQDPTFLPIIFAADDDADWQDENVWYQCNPALGDFRSLEDMRILAARAKQVPAQQNNFRRLYLNQWTQQDIRAIDMAQWEACEPPESVPRGTPCYAGLDLGQSDDFSSFVMMWPMDDDRVVTECRYWLPEAAVTDSKYTQRPYDQWRREGKLIVTPGEVTDYSIVESDVEALCEEHGVRELAYDKRFAEQMAQRLEAHGIEMVDQPQGFQLHEACTRLFELVETGRLCHGDDPILSWMASNLVVRTDREQRIRPDKNRATEKIDGIVALLMALAAWLRAPEEMEFTGEVQRISW